jgi:hypothetical protein
MKFETLSTGPENLDPMVQKDFNNSIGHFQMSRKRFECPLNNEHEMRHTKERYESSLAELRMVGFQQEV